MIGKADVVLPYSEHLFAIAKKLKELGFLTRVSVEAKGDSEVKKNLVVALVYNEQGVAKLRGVKRISKPGRRLYAPSTAAHRVKGGTGSRILSSSLGIVTDAEARKSNVGGEDLFEIW